MLKLMRFASAQQRGSLVFRRLLVETFVERIGRICIFDLADDRAFVRLPVPLDDNLKVNFREQFQNARWDMQSRSWMVPGTRAAHRVRIWANDILTFDRGANATLAFNPEAEFLKRRDELPYIPVFFADGIVSCPFAYNFGAVQIARSMPGRAYDIDEKIWSWRARNLSEADTIIKGLKAISAIMQQLAQRGRFVYSRYILPAAYPGRVGNVVQGNFKPFGVITWTHIGPVFRMVTGPHRFIYYRDATDQEFVDFNAKREHFAARLRQLNTLQIRKKPTGVDDLEEKISATCEHNLPQL
jgi:hypothetical protein